MNKELLRPFDLEAAKAGALVTTYTNTDVVMQYIAGPDDKQCFVHSCTQEGFTWFALHLNTSLRMAPLAWLEGKPVYKGDVVYYKPDSCSIKEPRIVLGQVEHTNPVGLAFEGDYNPWAPIYTLTWTKPVTKVKKAGWINVYKTSLINRLAMTSCVHHTKEQADREADVTKLSCIRIEWEEEA